MVALLLAVALVVLTVSALLLAGVVAAVCTGVGLLNALVLALGLRSRRAAGARAPAPGERWHPKSFRRPPAAPPEPEAEERLRSHSLTVRRR